MNFYKHHIGDYDSATAHLSMVEDGAYRRLLSLYYRTEKPIPADISQACRLVRAHSDVERAAVEQVLREFFSLQPDGWHKARCDEEIAAAKVKAEHNRQVGAMGGRPHKTQMVSGNNPDGFCQDDARVPKKTLASNQKPVTSNQSTSPPTPADAGVVPPQKRAARKVPLPEGFAVSPQVAAWAAVRGYLDLDRHLDAFCRKAQAKGYRYADWDAAFMEAIREDWAKLRAQPPPGREDREARQRATYEGLTGKRAGNERSSERVIDGEVRRIA